jgi:hypothetical protein
MAQSIVLEHRGSIVVEPRPGNCAVSRGEWPMVAAELFEVTALAVAGGMRFSTVSNSRHCVSSACSPNGHASVSLKVRHLVSRHGLDVPKSG